jgi:hypothetical protein
MSKATTTKKTKSPKPKAQVIKAKGIKLNKTQTVKVGVSTINGAKVYNSAKTQIIEKKSKGIDLVVFNKIKLDLNHGMSTQAVAKKHKVGETTVRRIRRAANLNVMRKQTNEAEASRKYKKAHGTSSQPLVEMATETKPSQPILGDDKVKLNYVRHNDKRTKPVTLVSEKIVEKSKGNTTVIKKTSFDSKGLLVELFAWALVVLVLVSMIWFIVFIIKAIIGLF